MGGQHVSRVSISDLGHFPSKQLVSEVEMNVLFYAVVGDLMAQVFILKS